MKSFLRGCFLAANEKNAKNNQKGDQVPTVEKKILIRVTVKMCKITKSYLAFMMVLHCACVSIHVVPSSKTIFDKVEFT